MSPPLSTTTNTVILTLIFLNFILIQSITVNAQSQRQQRKLLDESTTPPSTPTGEIKCGGCSSCSNPCAQSPPPPSPPPPPPPSPPKKPPVVYCPPPPAAPYIYITGPPGDLYPVDPYYYGSSSRVTAGLVMVGLFVAAAGFW